MIDVAPFLSINRTSEVGTGKNALWQQSHQNQEPRYRGILVCCSWWSGFWSIEKKSLYLDQQSLPFHILYTGIKQLIGKLSLKKEGFCWRISGIQNTCMQLQMTYPLMQTTAQSLHGKITMILDMKAIGDSTRMLKVIFFFLL